MRAAVGRTRRSARGAALEPDQDSPAVRRRAAGQLVADRERVGFVAGAVRRRRDARCGTLLAGGVEAASTEALRARRRALRGELLEGLELPSCYRYHEWCVGEREALRALRIGALAELVARLSRRQRRRDLEEALRWARQRVAIDPLTEAAHVDVVRILGRLGRVREALAQYETCRRILETELGARASQALEQARRELTARRRAGACRAEARVRRRGARRGRASGDDDARRAIGPPLVGRDAPRAAVEAAVADAARRRRSARCCCSSAIRASARRACSIWSPTRCARPAGRSCAGARSRPRWSVPTGPGSTRCAAAPPPRRDLDCPGPLRAAARRGAVGAARPRRRTAPGRATVAGFEAVARLLLARGASGAGCSALVLDDVQWLDEASAALLHFVARGARRADAHRVRRARRRARRQRGGVARGARPRSRAAPRAAPPRAARPRRDGGARPRGQPRRWTSRRRSRRARATRSSPSRSRARRRRGPTVARRLARRPARRAPRAARRARPAICLPWAAALGRSFDPEVLALGSAATAAAALARRARAPRAARRDPRDRGRATTSPTISCARPPTGVCRSRAGAWSTCRSPAGCRRRAAATMPSRARSPTTPALGGDALLAAQVVGHRRAALPAPVRVRARRRRSRPRPPAPAAHRAHGAHPPRRSRSTPCWSSRGRRRAEHARRSRPSCRARSSRRRRRGCTPRRRRGFARARSCYFTAERLRRRARELDPRGSTTSAAVDAGDARAPAGRRRPLPDAARERGAARPGDDRRSARAARRRGRASSPTSPGRRACSRAT